MLTGIFICLIGTTLAVPPPTNYKIERIVGGSDVDISVYPYMSNMQFLQGNAWLAWCGGSLLTPTSVLSAAQCYQGDLPSSWRARLGSSFDSSGGTVHTVSALILHHQFDRTTMENDVAIVKLFVPAVASSTVGFADIAGPRFHAPDNAPVMVVGWGSLLQSVGPYPETLQHAQVNIISQEECAHRYASLKAELDFQHWPDITNLMICSGILNVEGTGTCAYDAGGPLEYNGVVVGIISWSYSCADAIYPGVNARVAPLSEWIISNAL